MSHLAEKVDRSIRARGLLRRGQSVLVAVSGGVDSMVLLHVLHELSEKNSWDLTVAHLNHRLRGRSSDADQQLVHRVAKKLGVRMIAESADVKKIARSHKISIEMAARQARHEFLARTAARLRIKTVALAHHAGDQVELFFLRLFRGSGSEGLAGMKWWNPSPANSKIVLARPLLDQPKAALLEYAASGKIPFREDASNASFEIQRNRIRHELLPWLQKKYQPAIERTIIRLMDIAAAEADCVGQLAADWLNRKNRTPFHALPVAVQRRCIQLQILQQRFVPDYDLIECLRTRPGRPVSIAPGNSLVLGASGQLRAAETRRGESNLDAAAFELQGSSGDMIFADVKIAWRIRSRTAPGLPRHRVGREFFDANKVGHQVILRHWRPGDRFQPSGMKSPVKLQDLFTNQKIPRNERSDLVVAITGTGELFWVEKLRISEQFKLSNDTNRRLEWRWNRG